MAGEVAAGMGLVDQARAVRAALDDGGSDVVRLGRSRRTVDDVRFLCAALAVRRGPFPAPAGRPLRFAGRGLAVVNTVALAVVLSRLEGAPDAAVPWVSAVLGLCVCGLQVGLAFDLGRRLRPFAGQERAFGPPRHVVIEAGLLVALGSLTGVTCYDWAQRVAHGSIGTVGGLVVAGSALAAPLMIVADEVYGPGVPGRTLHRCERVLETASRRERRLRRRDQHLLAAARRRLARAEVLLVDAANLGGPDDPVVAALDAGVRELRAAITDLWGDGTGAVPPLDPDDLGLAG